MMAHILNYIVPFIRKPIVWLIVLILGLGVWSWRQSSEIDSLQATNHAQAQAIIQFELEQATLHQALMEEKQAVEKQQKFANELKAKSESKREKARVIFKDSPCANTALPSGIVEQLQ
ncbi:DUF2570 family protein [Ursidibacter arcticus]